MVSSVVDFYRGKTIFLTGGTGFLGVALIEKLLRSCPDLKGIYVLIRPKKQKDIEQRLEEITKNSVFDRLREEGHTDLFKKLIPVAGDVGQENLGLSSADRLTLVEQVDIVVHSAATLDFEAELKDPLNINLLGTRRVVQICQEIRNLKVLVHISSAYVNAVLNEAKEQVYPPPADVNELLKRVRELDDEELVKQTPTILGPHPNTYTFTKHLAEHEVVNGKIPAAIVRPSMINAAWKEPKPGWTISKNGPQGFLMGASKGVVRRLPADPHLIYDYIPIDTVVNNIITAAYAIDRDSSKDVKVYHCTSSTYNPFRWETIEDDIPKYLYKYPLSTAVWYAYIKLLPSIFLFKISAFFVHLIPAYILDTVTKLSGGRPILVRLHTNVNKSLGLLERFIFSEWKFFNDRTLELHKSLSEADKETFNLDIKSLVWKDYFVNLVIGVRLYLHKDPLKTLDRARSKARILYVANVAVQLFVLGLICWLTKICFATTWTKASLVIPIVYFLFDQL